MVIQYTPKQLRKNLQIALLATLCCLGGCETAPPVQEMSDARQAITVAKEAGAAERAALHLKVAEKYLESAEQNLGEQAYQQARRDANQAKMKARDALEVSENAAEAQ